MWIGCPAGFPPGVDANQFSIVVAIGIIAVAIGIIAVVVGIITVPVVASGIVI